MSASDIFAKTPFDRLAAELMQKLGREITGQEANYIAHVSEKEFAKHLASKYLIEPLRIDCRHDKRVYALRSSIGG